LQAQLPKRLGGLRELVRMDPRLERRETQRRGTARRRRIAALAAIVVVAVLAALLIIPAVGGSGAGESNGLVAAEEPTASPKATAPASAPKPAGPPPQQITDAVPGEAEVISEGPSAGRKVALTFDDGTCAACVAKILDVLEQTGAAATFFPNGTYGASWEPQAKRIRSLVASGQLTLGNHTFSHGVSTQIGSAAFGADLQRNEDWIQKTFKLSGRPWFRPPFGDYDSGTVSAAGERGYRKVVMWSGTVADSDLRSEAYILNAIQYWAKPGRIILMHANYAPTAEVLPRILKLLERKKLTPVTISELLKDA
jgi:peptidoglycan-N-acetylglucosamine deacetylase